MMPVDSAAREDRPFSPQQFTKVMILLAFFSFPSRALRFRFQYVPRADAQNDACGDPLCNQIQS
jgi:hypothetical protein